MLFYFLVFFTISLCVVEGFTETDTSEVIFDDTGFGSKNEISTSGNINPAASITADTSFFTTIIKTLSVITGIRSESVMIGVPALWRWLFSFVFFYIPLFMLIWSIYMAIPVIH